jgi:hypothetical protein
VTPPGPDADVIERRLRLLRQTLDDLAVLRGVDAARLLDDLPVYVRQVAAFVAGLGDSDASAAAMDPW